MRRSFLFLGTIAIFLYWFDSKAQDLSISIGSSGDKDVTTKRDRDGTQGQFADITAEKLETVTHDRSGAWHF